MIAAFKERRLVWSATSWMTSTIRPISWLRWPSASTISAARRIDSSTRRYAYRLGAEAKLRHLARAA